MSTDVLDAFAAEVGPSDPVVAVGGRTHWDLGGAPRGDAREVMAPAGIAEHDPAEMVVRVRAGTTVADLHAALATHGQETALDASQPESSTVGGVLAAGQSGLRRLRLGPVRDAVLEVRFVTASGDLAKGGGPVVKNVTGFDVCRLLVGSLGTLGIIAEVVLRCVPIPSARRWLRSESDPFSARAALYRPSAVLWDGTATWVLLEGHGDDVGAQAAVLGDGWVEVAGPPPLPPHRHSLDPALLAARGRGAGGSGTDSGVEGQFDGRFVAEIGIGTVHCEHPQARRVVPDAVRKLNERVKAQFDPTGRLGPGRSVL